MNDNSSNKMLLVDEIVHAGDMDFLGDNLGVSDFPNKLVLVAKFEQMGEWLNYWHKCSYPKLMNEQEHPISSL